ALGRENGEIPLRAQRLRTPEEHGGGRRARIHPCDRFKKPRQRRIAICSLLLAQRIEQRALRGLDITQGGMNAPDDLEGARRRAGRKSSCSKAHWPAHWIASGTPTTHPAVS